MLYAKFIQFLYVCKFCLATSQFDKQQKYSIYTSQLLGEIVLINAVCLEVIYILCFYNTSADWCINAQSSSSSFLACNSKIA